MPDLGKLNGAMVWRCVICRLDPPPKMTSNMAKTHFRQEHPDSDNLELERVAVCTCGHIMILKGQGEFKYYMVCPSCGNTGFVKKDK